MTEYQVQTTSVPPVIRLIEGALYVEMIFGAQTFRAPIGDGRFFFSQVVEKLVDPALLVSQQLADAKAMACYLAGTYVPLASPND